MSNKFKLTKETKVVNGKTLYRIKSLKQFALIQKGELGGWLQFEDNLSYYGDCWIAHNACVYDNAIVCDNAFIQDNAAVYGNAHIYSNAIVSNNAEVYGEAYVGGYTQVKDRAKVFGNGKIFGFIRVFKTVEIKTKLLSISSSDGYTFVIARDYMDGQLKILAGCRYFTIEEAKQHWTKTRGGTPLGEERLAIVAFLAKVARINKI